MEPLEPQSIIDAAERAAASGDYVSAEKFLREVARAQEKRLGPLNPDLANTLNNLGVVCEINGKPAEAERCFRRALDIATDVFEPDHPFIATSRQNLQGLRDARGKADAERTSRPHEKQDGQTRDPRRSPRTFPTGALGPAAMVIIIGAAGYAWLGSIGQAESHSVLATAAPPLAPAPPVTIEKAAPVEPIPSRPAGTVSGPAAVNADPVATESPARPTVVKARLCVELGDWICNPADLPVTAGPLFFYTQVKSTTATTIQHRWYRGDRLQQSIDLQIEATPAGYRSFSRVNMTNESTGDWRVELRAADGALLHEERFSAQ